MAINVLVAFYSRNGASEALAKAVAEGAQAEGAEVRLRRARELVGAEIINNVPGWRESMERQNALYPAPSAEDVEWADAVVFGAPTRFGVIASELKAFIDSLGGLWSQGKMFNKVGSAFAATATNHGGAEMTVIGLFAVMSHLGMVIVPNGYGDAVNFQAGSPYGSHTAVDGQYVTAPADNDLAVARVQGRRLAKVAAALKPLRG